MTVEAAILRLEQAIREKDMSGTIDAQTLLDIIKTVDGAGSGLDADLLQGMYGELWRNDDTVTADTVPSLLESGIITLNPDNAPTNRGIMLTVKLSSQAYQLFFQRDDINGFMYRKKSASSDEWLSWSQVSTIGDVSRLAWDYNISIQPGWQFLDTDTVSFTVGDDAGANTYYVWMDFVVTNTAQMPGGFNYFAQLSGDIVPSSERLTRCIGSIGGTPDGTPVMAQVKIATDGKMRLMLVNPANFTLVNSECAIKFHYRV